MLPLLNAIYSRFTSSSALTSAITGGLHRDRAPEATPMPYAVSRIVSSQTQYAYGAASRSLITIRFSIIGSGHDATGQLARMFAGVFDSPTLALSSGINDSIVRQGEPTPTLLRHDAQGNDVWEWSISYEFGVVNF